MNIERIYKVVLMDLTSEQLKLEEKLEKIINSDRDVSEKSPMIRGVLSDLILVETSIAKFTAMLTPKNNDEIKPTPNE